MAKKGIKFERKELTRKEKEVIAAVNKATENYQFYTRSCRKYIPVVEFKSAVETIVDNNAQAVIDGMLEKSFAVKSKDNKFIKLADALYPDFDVKTCTNWHEVQRWFCTNASEILKQINVLSEVSEEEQNNLEEQNNFLDKYFVNIYKMYEEHNSKGFKANISVADMDAVSIADMDAYGYDVSYLVDVTMKTYIYGYVNGRPDDIHVIRPGVFKCNKEESVSWIKEVLSNRITETKATKEGYVVKVLK